MLNQCNNLQKEELEYSKGILKALNISKAQDADENIKRVKNIIKEEIDLTPQQKQQESIPVKRLLRERKTSSYQ